MSLRSAMGNDQVHGMMGSMYHYYTLRTNTHGGEDALHGVATTQRFDCVTR